MAELREGQTGVAPDGTRVIVRNGQIVPVEAPVNAGGAAAAGFTDLGDGWYRAQDGGTFQRNRQGQLIRRTGTAGGDQSERRTARRDFEALAPVQDFRSIQSAYNSMMQAASDGTGASDIALVMAWNKVMDPTSVVREGEFDRAMSVGGIPDKVQALVTKAMNGEVLTPRQRQQIVDTAQGTYEVRRDQYNDMAVRYRGLAESDGLAPDAVARQEFRGQRITANPDTQEMGQANRDQVAARPDDYDRQAPLGSPQRPYILSPGVTIDRLPAGSSYIDMDGNLTVAGEADRPGASAENAIDYTSADLPPDQLMAFVGQGGWIRNGPDGEPYQVEAGAVRRANAEGGDREVAPGIFERAQDQNAETEGLSTQEAVEQYREMPKWEREIVGGFRGAIDGLTLGFSDEIGAGIDAAIGYGPGETFGERYRNSVDRYRAVADADVEDVVGARRIGQGVGILGGGLGAIRGGAVAARAVPALAMETATQGATRGANALRITRNVARGAGAGAAAGGASSAGYTEGDLAERGANALGGAAIGAVAAPIAAGAVNALAPVVSAGAGTAGRFVGRQVAGAMQNAGVPGGNALAARSAAPDALESGLRMYGAKTPLDPVAMRADAAAFRENGIEPAFFDVVGDGGQAVGRALATRQTQGRATAISEGSARRVGAQDRVSEIARRNVSSDPRTASQVADDLAEEQSTLSAQEMRPIRGEMVDLTPETAAVFRTPGGRQAIEQARKWAANSEQGEELAALSRLADDSLDQPGNIQLSLGTLDRLRRSLRNQGLAARRATDGDAVQGIGGLERKVRTDATNAVPEYGRFLKDYADRAQLEEAGDFGASYLGRSGTEDFARAATEMNPAQREVARVSARDVIENRGNTPAGAASMLDELSVGRGAGRRGDALLGDDAAKLRSNAEFARRELETGRNISPRTGSPTNDNQQGSALVNGVAEAAMIGRDVATGNKVGLVQRGADFLRNRGFNDDQASAIIEAAFDRGRTDELIDMLARTGMTRREARNTARMVRYVVTAPSAATAAQ